MSKLTKTLLASCLAFAVVSMSVFATMEDQRAQLAKMVGRQDWGNLLVTILDTMIDANGAFDGEQIGDNTIDEDSIDWGTGTDQVGPADMGITATAAELNALDGITSTVSELNILDGCTATYTELNLVDGVTATTAELNIVDGVTSTAAEINVLDGIAATLTYDELDILDGVTSTAAELNILDGCTSTFTELNLLDGVTSTTAELNIVDGVTATATEINVLDGIAATLTYDELDILDGVTSTTAELNILDTVTSTAAELNILDGVTSTTAELNILDTVTATATELNILDGVTATEAEIDAVADLSARGTTYTSSTDIGAAATAAELDGKIYTLSAAAGLTITLPPATGSDAQIQFYIGSTVTSNAVIINADAEGEDYVGTVHTTDDGAAGDAGAWVATPATSDSVNLDGSTQGGYVGDWLIFTDIASTVWHVTGSLQQTGTEATPFANIAL